MNYNTIRGTRDLTEDQLSYHKYIIKAAELIAEKYRYSLLETPIIENTNIFHRTLGETSDIVAKETYTFLDRDKTSITLRPEFTAAVVRAFLSGNFRQEIPVKFFSYGPVFRHERPQKARYRQFSQINFEFFGALTPYSDIETILLSYDILKELGLLDDITLEINTLGDQESRKLYKKKLIEYFSKYESDLSETSRIRLERNPLRILDSKDKSEKVIIEGAPNIEDVLNLESKKYYLKVLEGLELLGIQYNKNNKLVRGMDYYNHTVFEFASGLLGSQSAVLAGGRYDSLVRLMGGPEVPAIGFAGGVDRLVELLKLKDKRFQKLDFIYLIPIGEESEIYSIKLAKQLRDANFIINIEFGMKLKKRLQRADKQNASHVVIFGSEELLNNTLNVKDMETGKTECISKDNIVDYFISKLDKGN